MSTPATLRQDLGTALADRAQKALPAAARGVSQLLVRHLLARNGSADHRPGFPRTNYWARAARAVKTEIADPATATIRVFAPGIRLHLLGGVVRPVEAKRLALPLRPEVAGKRPRELEGQALFVWKRKSAAAGRAYLVRRDPGGHLTLLSSATHRADPSVLPPRADLVSAAARGAKLAT